MSSPLVPIIPPERAQIPALLENVAFDGPSPLVLPNGTVVCGQDADASLNSHLSQVRVARAESAQTPGSAAGLILVHSHRQRIRDFRDHARALGLVASGDDAAVGARLFGGASILLVNNNAAELFKRLGDMPRTRSCG